MKNIIKIFKTKGVVNAPKNADQFWLAIQKYQRSRGVDVRDFFEYTTDPALINIAKEADLLPEYMAAICLGEGAGLYRTIRVAHKTAKRFNMDVETISQRMMAFFIKNYDC